MSLRDDLDAEIAACKADHNRDPFRLQMLMDEHAMMPGFDALIDGERENEAIRTHTAMMTFRGGEHGNSR